VGVRRVEVEELVARPGCARVPPRCDGSDRARRTSRSGGRPGPSARPPAPRKESGVERPGGRASGRERACIQEYLAKVRSPRAGTCSACAAGPMQSFRALPSRMTWPSVANRWPGQPAPPPPSSRPLVLWALAGSPLPLATLPGANGRCPAPPRCLAQVVAGEGATGWRKRATGGDAALPGASRCRWRGPTRLLCLAKVDAVDEESDGYFAWRKYAPLARTAAATLPGESTPPWRGPPPLLCLAKVRVFSG
jgi:hypothetical protein